MPQPCSPSAPTSAPPIDWSAFRSSLVDIDTLAIVRATCLLESRSSKYGAYLVGVLPPGFAEDIRRWADEEAHHGGALRRWLSLADPDFDIDAASHGFDQIPYHEGERGPIRGGVAQELLSRCVVEALASTYYRALRDGTREPLLQQICTRLMADERRHLELFAGLRIRELDDDQIVQAANWANHGGGGSRSFVRDVHLVRVVGMHRGSDLRYAHDLLWPVIRVGRTRGWPRLAVAVGLAITRSRQLLATVRLTRLVRASRVRSRLPATDRERGSVAGT
jgi:hypothetical protein